MRRTVRITQHAEAGTTFAPRAFDRSVGRMVPLNLPDGTTGQAMLLSAVVADDGATVSVTLELDA